jgi:hypothetical protein
VSVGSVAGVTKRRFPFKATVDVVTSGLLIGAAIAVLWVNLAGPPPSPSSSLRLPREPISIAEAATRGSPQAPVALVEFSDFECPFCATFCGTLPPEVTRDYVTGRCSSCFGTCRR